LNVKCSSIQTPRYVYDSQYSIFRALNNKFGSCK
jgi:hypothetical protein